MNLARTGPEVANHAQAESTSTGSSLPCQPHPSQVADPTHPLLSADRVELQISRRLGQRLTHSRAFRRQTEKRLPMD
jgi:hypothetical protein